MRRFFVDPDNITGATAVLTGSEARHIATVLRLTTGTMITLFDGSGSYYEARLTKITPARADAKILSITPYIPDADTFSPALHLGVGLLKGKKMDFVVQKTTELGITSLHPFRSQYCATPDSAPDKLSRWHKISLEACKQCNRPIPPDIYDVTDFNDLLSGTGKNDNELKLIFWEDEGQKHLRDVLGSLAPIRSAQIIIGPEGGFSASEVADAVAAGYQTITLGSRILRAETAAIVAVAILQHELGNLG